MRERWQTLSTPMTLALCAVLTTYALLLHSGYLTNYENLQTLLFLEVLMVALWFYRQWFFPFLLVIFGWSGTVAPMHELFTVARWAILGAGAVTGFTIYLKRRRHHFGVFHLAALLCAVTATASALVSAYPTVAALKALSLFLLFMFAATGGRLIASDREAAFMSRFVIAVEVLVVATAVAYFAFHYQIYGNPNALGAVMGVVAVPVMLWGVLISTPSFTRARRIIVLILAALLLLSSYARAGMIAAAIACIFVSVGLRKYAALAQGLLIGIVLMVFVSQFMPEQIPDQSEPQPFIAAYLYKGHQEAGLLGSRKSVWDRTTEAIRQSPFLGSGFGTSAANAEKATEIGSFSSTTEVTREHGNSYLAITEWVGLVGVLPFVALLVILSGCCLRVLRLMHRTGNPRLVVVPMAAIAISGLVHAGFEDWLFAPGYYLCVLYWTLAFIFVDVASTPGSTPEGVEDIAV